MQVLQTTTTDLSPIDAKDLRSRHVLTDLLTEQIDMNEELSGENQLLAFQQRKLILLLTQKDTQISKYRNQVNAPDLAGKTTAARKIQFTLFNHLIGRITDRHLASAFETIKYSAQGSTAAARFENLVEKHCVATKTKLLKYIILSASNFRNRQEIKSLKLYTILHKLVHKQYSRALNGLHKHVASYESFQNVKLSGALLLSSVLHSQLYLRVMNSAFSKIKESAWSPNNNQSIAAERIFNLFNGVKNRFGREAILKFRMKPYQEAAFQVMKVTITSKKFLGLQFLNFLLQKLKNRVVFQAFLKIKATQMGSSGKLEKFYHILDKHTTFGADQLQLTFSKLRLHSYAQQLHSMHIHNKAQKLSIKLEQVFARSLKTAFNSLLGEKENIFPHIALTRKKHDQEEKGNKKYQQTFGKENWPSTRNKIHKRPQTATNRKMTFKGAYKILQNKYTESNKQHAIQLTNCMGMMGAKLMNFQQLNEQIIRESRETIRRTQELEDKLEAKKKREKELTEKLEELMNETKNNVETKSHLSIELNQALNQLAHAEEKIKGYEKKCTRLMQNNEKLENDKNSLVEKAEELMDTLQTIQGEYHKNKQDLKEALSNNQLLNENLQDKNREVNRLREKYSEIEDEFKHIKKLSEKKLSSSQGEKLSGEAKELKSQINKLKKERNEISDKYEEILSQNNRLKSTNAELTKEVITMNEEKNAFKAQMLNIKDTTSNSKREVAVVEMKLQKALQELEDKKSQLMQKIANERTTPEYVNQILDEKKSIENENRTLKQRLDKMTNIMNTYDKNAIKQTDELLSYQKETEMLRDHRLTAKNEIKDLNESLANLNRDKVNLMREMTLINDRNVKLEKEADAYRKLIEELQNEIQNYQLQMDVYVQVLKSMEDKMNRLENKSKLTMSVLSNNSTYGANYHTQGSTQRDNTLDLDEDELMNRLKTIKNKIETAHP